MLETDLIMRLLISIAAGALVGLEREAMHKPAGLRTHMLVSLGACLFTIISLTYISNSAPVLAGILTGIGFIGAGSIIGSRGQVHGVTTAASLWVVAAIGFASGVGDYILAFITAILVFVILQLGRIEKDKK